MNKPGIDTTTLPVEGTVSADYDSDVVRWFEKQVEHLRARQFNQLDLDNLIEELEAMPARDRRELGSRLKVLLMHLLKCKCQPEKISVSWLSAINTQRSEIADLLDQSPSLQGEIAARALRAYPSAVRGAALETGLAESAFPDENPFSPDQLLDHNFLP